MFDTNVAGTEVVLTSARDAGCDPIIHVSSVATIFPAAGPIPPDPPIGTNDRSPYVGSKVLAERVARRHQDGGAPVVTVYPGTVFGPHDPGPGEMVNLLRGFLGNRFPFRSASAHLPVADVRWVARGIAALTSAPGARRVTMSGHFLAWSEIFESLRRLTGRRLPLVLPTTPTVSRATGRVLDILQRGVAMRMPFGYENTWILYASAPTDDTAVTRLIGGPPPVDLTFGDAITWAVKAGHLRPSLAGALAA